jgi:hypothetical protein
MVYIHHLDSDNIQGLGVAPAGQKYPAVTSNDHSHGKMKSPAALVCDETDGVAIG